MSRSPLPWVVALALCSAARLSAAADVTAQSGSRDDVQAAVDLAQAGDTVVIPAGTFTLTGTVTIDKPITVKGAGATATTLDGVNGDYEYMFGLTGAAVTIRDLGLHGVPQGSGAIYDYGIWITDCQDFVIRDCSFKDFGGGAVEVMGDNSRGVVAHSEFLNIFRPEIDNFGYGVDVTAGGAANWNLPLDLGTERAVFVEDCSFTGCRHAVSSGNGSRYVFRYNQTHDSASNFQHLDTHGLEYGNSRGSRSAEIYNNVISDADGSPWAGITIRGGDGVIANNTFPFVISSPILLSNRLDDSSTCSYPNEDQTRELYVWNNTMAGSPVEVTIFGGHECLFQLDRDYFYHAPDGYVPYTYPHPLLGGTPPDDGGVGDGPDSPDDAGGDTSEGGVRPDGGTATDGGVPSGGRDGAGPAAVDDAGQPADDGAGSVSSGCGCRAAAGGGEGLAALAVLLLGLLLRAPERRRSLSPPDAPGRRSCGHSPDAATAATRRGSPRRAARRSGACPCP